jgi:thiol-disulfide isomerase/thioredoxin
MIMNSHAKEDKVFTAAEFDVKDWVDANGNETSQVRLSDFKGKFKVVFCFQSWCPGCHSFGLPNLKKMVEALKDNDKVVFVAIQTVFEGYQENTFAKMLEAQKKYELRIPFGHDAGDDGQSRSNFMRNYQTGGTPWFVFIDENDNVVFAGFQINVDVAIHILESVEL